MQEKTCCVTGHRDIPAAKTEWVKQELQREIQQAIQDGYTVFISGFAEGVDLLFAECVVKQKQQHPRLFLEAAIPYANRLHKTDQSLLKKCNGVKIVCKDYQPDCFMLRNRYMVQHSSRVIAVYDGREKGGTLFTMRYAHTQEREVRLIEL